MSIRLKKFISISLFIIFIVSAGTTVSVALLLHPYDTDYDWVISDFEILDAIDAWVDKELDDFGLLALIDLWAQGCYCWDAAEETYAAACADSAEGSCEEETGFALDFTDCPGVACFVSFNQPDGVSEKIEGKEITLEAWIKPKSASGSIILSRADFKRGAVLQVRATSTPSSVVPRFEIRRVLSNGTSSVAYFVDGVSITINSVWTHISGILTNRNHSAIPGHPHCTSAYDPDARDDPWHMDIYQNGLIKGCAATYGGMISRGYPDPTPAALAYAHEPLGNYADVNYSGGIIDEARIWNMNREPFLNECMFSELGMSGNCSYTNNMVLYSNFNEGEGDTVTYWSGVMGSGIKEYIDPAQMGLFLPWESGWTTDTP